MLFFSSFQKKKLSLQSEIKITTIMTALQLNVALHREMSRIITDSTMMERALKSLRRIRKERKAEQLQQTDTAEQVTANLRQAFQEF